MTFQEKMNEYYHKIDELKQEIKSVERESYDLSKDLYKIVHRLVSTRPVVRVSSSIFLEYVKPNITCVTDCDRFNCSVGDIVLLYKTNKEFREQVDQYCKEIKYSLS